MNLHSEMPKTFTNRPVCYDW